MEAINQLASTLIWCVLVIDWVLRWIIISSVVIFVFRAIKLARMPFGVLR